MDRQLLERMVGAGVLVVALIVIVPAVLNGSGSPDRGASQELTIQDDRDLKTLTLRPNGASASPPVAREARELVANPPAPAAGPAVEPSPERVAKAEAQAEITAATEEITPVTAVEPVPVQVAKAKPKPEPKPKPPPVPVATPEPTTQPSREGWAVQVGAFASLDKAQRLRRELVDKGYAVYVQPVTSNGQTLHRVRVGPASERSQAEAFAGKLKTAGYAGRVTREKP